jgi:deoxyribodipyrimidine photo-lyase
MSEHTLLWFRADLRLRDNPALAAAARSGRRVIPVFIHAPEEEGAWPPGAASNWWLFHALAELREALEAIGLPLVLRRGPSLAAIESLAGEFDVRGVYWNRRYEPAARERDAAVERALERAGVQVRHFNAALLFEPDEVRNRSGQPFRVYTPFWKHLRTLPVPAPEPVATRDLAGPDREPESVPLEDLGLLPQIDWDAEFYSHWKPGLQDATDALRAFTGDGVLRYREQRDLPGVEGTSRLSPYLHFGQLGPRQVWQAVHQAGAAETGGGYTFLSELAWREFAHHLLFHFPHTPERALNEAYREFPWQPEPRYLRAWQEGRTGYPIVDAGMRQLWRTGWMHNRVRMIAASFLVKHLLQPWQEGARWFWDTLVDADLASNTMGWQWTAGCGADAAPYFRIFNPMLQGAKFDPRGEYVRRFVPELAGLPDEHIHQPWEAPSSVLEAAGVRLGDNYPQAVIGHREGRQRALDALALNKSRSG